MSAIVPASSLLSAPNPQSSTPSFFKKNIGRLAEVIKANASSTSTFIRRPIAYMVGPSPAQKAIIKNLDELAEQSDSYIKKLYFQELKTLVASLKNTDDVGEVLKQIDETAQQLEALTDYATHQVHNLMQRWGFETSSALITEADHIYRYCMNRFHDLQNLPSTKVQRALYSGRLTTIFRNLDNAISDRGREGTLHRYCGCHIKAKGDDHGLKLLAPGIRGKDPKFLVDHPQHQAHAHRTAHPSAVLMSQSYGGGHNVVQHAMSQRLAEQGGHAYKVEADEEIFEEYYKYRELTGKSGAEWSQYFLQGNYFRTIRFLGWLSGGSDSKKTLEKKVACSALPLLARGHQDLAMVCFQRGTSPLEKAASRVGTGLYEIATDLDFQVFDFKKDVENPHFKHGMMARHNEREKAVLNRALEPHQLVETGFPVRDAFLKKYTVEELRQIRAHYQQKYNLAPDARVVLLLCGGEGVSNTMAETLANNYPANGPKIHLFAICGKNGKKKQSLEAQFANLHKSNFHATALGWTNEKELGELFAMGALEKDKGLLISAKTGGGTISEAIARGIPILACEMTGIPHERLNLDFVVEKQLGKEFRYEAELPAKVVEMLGSPFTPIPSPTGEAYSDFHSKEKSMQVIQGLVADCRSDTAFQLRSTEAMRTLPLAFSLAPPTSDSTQSPALPSTSLSQFDSSEKTAVRTSSKKRLISSKRLAKIEKLIRKFGWDELMNPVLLERPEYLNFLKFLYESRLIFAIHGYQASLQSTESPMKNGIQFFNGEPHLLKEGRWTAWDEIINTYKIDRQLGIIFKGSTAPWNYLYPHGLTQQARYNWVGQVQQLTSEEMGHLYESSKAFFSTQPEKMPTQANCAFLQVYTNGDGFSDRIGGHVGIRLIDQNGKLYSLGFERQKNKNALAKIFSVLGTYNAAVSSLDFKEFAKFDFRRITTIPMDSETFQRLLQKVQDYTENPLRINFLHQNCVTLAADLLREAGVPIEVRSSSASAALFNAMAPTCVRKIVQAVKNLFAHIPSCIRKPIQFIATVITHLPSKLCTLFKNLLLLIFGAGKVANPPKAGAENVLDNSQRLTSFNRLFNNWTDLTQDIPVSVPYKIADWQMQQGSTELHTYEGPKFYVVKKPSLVK